MSSSWKRIDDSTFTAERDRFKITAHRRDSGEVREWSVLDTETGRERRGKNRNAIRKLIAEILARDLPPDLKENIEAEVKTMLHAHRDCLRNMGVDTAKVQFDARDGHYGEAFGVMRALVALGYGHFGDDNIDEPGNVKFWFRELEKQVLVEEGFGGDGRCAWCLERYGKDDASMREAEK